MKILVTGANGFVGSEIVRRLAAGFHEVYAVGRSANRNERYVKSENYFRADIASAKEVEEIARGCEIGAVIHCAGLAHQFGATSREAFWRVNVAGTKNVAALAAALKAKHFILISSVAVYGKNYAGGEAVGEDFRCDPRDDYAQSKLEGERTARDVLSGSAIRLTILRPATVIGEGDRGNFVRLIRAIEKKRFIWIGKGGNRKSLIHVEDVAASCVAVLESKACENEIYNVSAEPLRMKEIVDEIAHDLRVKVRKVRISERVLGWLFTINSKYLGIKKIESINETVRKWLAEDVYSAEKVEKTLGFKPKIVVREAIKREVEWYLADKNV